MPTPIISALTTFSEVETFLLSVATLREAMPAYRWMAALFDSIVTIKFETDDQLFTAKLQFIANTPYWVARLFAECSFSLLSRLALQRSGNDVRISQINFAHEDKGAIPVYQNLFRCAIAIAQSNYSISFSLADIDKPLAQASPALKALSRFQIEQRLKRLKGEKNLEQSVHELLMQHPYLMEKGIEECASRLYLSPRTLQRQLHDAGTSYRTIRDTVRRVLAKELLEGSSPLEKISDLLCFSDRRSFTRAFLKWEGVTPTTYRKSLC
ncbi:MAG: hypothetical protein C9356_14255 [Oleiphilus sp.]|nr:MAG: hypothetical protein C9356_14255 [Oleiphilus sp.]